jgi:hypothetical protein
LAQNDSDLDVLSTFSIATIITIFAAIVKRWHL